MFTPPRMCRHWCSKGLRLQNVEEKIEHKEIALLAVAVLNDDSSISMLAQPVSGFAYEGHVGML